MKKNIIYAGVIFLMTASILIMWELGQWLIPNFNNFMFGIVMTFIALSLTNWVVEEHPEKPKFMECVSCAAKPGSPTLCESCIHNRAAIEQLSQ
jgi:uncharacterized membrane protein SirB2